MKIDMPVERGARPVQNEFEKVDSFQTDALTLALSAQDGALHGVVHCPAAATGGRLPKDFTSQPMPGKEAIQSAIKLANDLKLPVVVLDPEELWPEDWGTLFIAED
ncbi:hypothetical protein [Bosea sp. (in: a-proteobacteria)]|uniref:hypothetical protein n=1 Tax=Bosea sp. (in: a-proteobacteria) TaxID=1871050 RepID=UPI003B3AAEF0